MLHIETIIIKGIKLRKTKEYPKKNWIFNIYFIDNKTRRSLEKRPTNIHKGSFPDSFIFRTLF